MRVSNPFAYICNLLGKFEIKERRPRTDSLQDNEVAQQEERLRPPLRQRSQIPLPFGRPKPQFRSLYPE